MELQKDVSARCGIKPEVALSRFTFDLRIEHLHRGFVNLQVIAGFKLFPDEPVDGQEQVRHLLHPLHHLLARDGYAKTLPKNPFQSVISQVVIKATEQEVDGQSQPQFALRHQPRRQRSDGHSLATGLFTISIFGAHDLANDQFGRKVIILGSDFLADAWPLLTTGGTELVLGLQDDLLFFQFYWREIAASSLLGALALLGSLLAQGLFEHLLAQGRGALGLLLSVAQELAQLLLLFFIELVRLGTEELSFEIGNDRLSFGQLLRFEGRLLLGLG